MRSTRRTSDEVKQRSAAGQHQRGVQMSDHKCAENGNDGFDDDVQPIWMKIMVVLECSPGVRDNGDKITILTISHLDEIEPPMMFSLTDTKRLAIDLLTSLAGH